MLQTEQMGIFALQAAQQHQDIFKLALSITRPPAGPNSIPASSTIQPKNQADPPQPPDPSDVEAVLGRAKQVSVYQGRITSAMVQEVIPCRHLGDQL